MKSVRERWDKEFSPRDILLSTMDSKEIWDKMKDAKTRTATRKHDENEAQTQQRKEVEEGVTKIREARAKIHETARSERDEVTEKIFNRIIEIYQSLAEHDPVIRRYVDEEARIMAKKAKATTEKDKKYDPNDWRVRLITVAGFPALQWGDKFELTDEDRAVLQQEVKPLVRPNRKDIPDEVVEHNYWYIDTKFDVPRTNSRDTATVEGIPFEDFLTDPTRVLDVIAQKLRKPMRVHTTHKKGEDFWKPIMPPVSPLMKSK